MTAALAVTALALSQFRSYRRLRLALDGRSVVLTGPNGAGKTNLIEALSLFSPGRGLRRAAAVEMAAAGTAGGWKVVAAIAAPDGAHEAATWSEGAGRQVTIDGKAAAQTALSSVARVLWLVPAMDRLWTEGAAERRRFLDRVAMSLIPDHAEAALGYDKALRHRNRLIRDDVRDPAWFEAVEAQMGSFGARLTANRLAALDRLGAVAPAAAFPRAELALEGEAPREATTLTAALREGRSRDRAAGRTLTGPHRDDLAAVYAAKGMPAALCSTGEQKALLISLVLANARAVADGFGAPPLLLLDEVAAHLDEDRRRALFDAVAGLGAQAWMTGTGPELFEGLGHRAERLLVSEAGGVSRVERA